MLTARTQLCTCPSALQAQPGCRDPTGVSPHGRKLPAAHTVLQALRRGHNSSWLSCLSGPAPPNPEAMLRWGIGQSCTVCRASRVTSGVLAKHFTSGRGAAGTQAWRSLALQHSAGMLETQVMPGGGCWSAHRPGTPLPCNTLPGCLGSAGRWQPAAGPRQSPL